MFRCALALTLSLASACVPGGMTEADAGIEPVEDAGYLPHTKAKKLALANGAVCALTETGKVRCWGWSGQADDTTESKRWTHFGSASVKGNSWVPVEVPGIADATDITSSYQHLCVVTSAKKAKCWGWNSAGQLGIGTDEGRVAPVEVPLSNVKQVRVGGEHSCALLEDGTVWCWGSNFNDQLEKIPVALQADRWSPLKVPYVTGATDLFVDGNATCVIMAGQVRCWGALMPMAGASTSDDPPRLLPISGLSALSFWTFNACGLVGGAAKCWGKPDDGWLGTGAQFADAVGDGPHTVKGLESGVTQVTVGGAVKDGKAFTWGEGYSGDGKPYGDALVPVEVSGVSNVVEVQRYGSSFSCLRTTDGKVYCWGANSSLQCGTPKIDENYLTPQRIPTFE